jgi:LCP family protein required for cell wall assembly
MRVHHERRVRAMKVTALVVGLVLLAATGGTAIWAYLTLQSAQRTMNAGTQADERIAAVLDKREPQKPFTVLLLGTDERPGEADSRTDTMILAKIDPRQEKVWLLSIPRDTRAEIPGVGIDKINAANFHGGPALTVQTVQALLGVPVNHYIAMNFEGFQAMVDTLGGVWIDVEVEIDDPKAASHGSRTAQYIAPGYQLLDGEHALTFVRSRDFIDADFTRMKHQQQFFKALADQATRFGNVFKLPVVVRDVAQYIQTDMSITQLADVALALRDMGGENVQAATLTGEWISPYVWLDEEVKVQLVSALLGGRPFEEPDAIAELIDPATVSITVRNGAGIEGCAAAAADILRTAGYAVGQVGNANQFVYDETLVVYASDYDAAMQVAAELPTAKAVEGRGMYEFSTDILVVVGRDYASW